jgi:LexA-binding, inner membrane-associated putative hydrolase
MPSTHHGTPAGWLAGFCAHRGASLAMAAVIAATDRGPRKQPRSFVRRAVVDEPCHVATAMIVLGTLTRWRGRPPSGWFTGAMLSSSVLIDLDHLPREFGSDILAAGMPRPTTHALWMMGAAAAAAAAAGHRYRASGSGGARIMTGIAAGTAWGLGAHFLRDLGTGPIALAWPLSRTKVRVPNSYYLATLPVLATLPPPRTAGRASLGLPDPHRDMGGLQRPADGIG